MIIGIVGLIGSGKTTASDYLVRHHSFTQEAFANSLKDVLSSIFGWNRLLLDGATPSSRAWREEPDAWWSKRLGFEVSPRLMLREWGTTLGRDAFHNEIWISSLENKMKHISGDVVISDCRFPNEIQAIRDAGGSIIRVKRGFEPDWRIDAENALSDKAYAERVGKRLSKKVHPSEWAWFATKLDHVIDNDGTIEELYKQLDDLVISLAANPPASK